MTQLEILETAAFGREIAALVKRVQRLPATPERKACVMWLQEAAEALEPTPAPEPEPVQETVSVTETVDVPPAAPRMQEDVSHVQDEVLVSDTPPPPPPPIVP